MFFQYQSFDDAPGMVDSRAKLMAFRLPPLQGLSVLDVGCNEGYYCGVAARAGATRVVGLDGNRDFIAAAKRRFPNIEFLCRSWDSLPDEQFDLVLFTSGFHYLPTIEAAVAMLGRLARCLKKNGTLVLEVGVAPDAGSQLVEVVRPDGQVRYPTIELFISMLRQAGLVERYMGQSTSGDGIERQVFHCKRFKPSVLFVRGGHGVGKTRMAWAVSGHDYRRIVSVDEVAHRAFSALYPDEAFDPRILNGIDELSARVPEKAVALLVDHLFQAIETCVAETSNRSWDSRAVLVDGLSDVLEPHARVYRGLLERLRDGYLIWNATCQTPPDRDWWDTQGTYFDAYGYLLPLNDPIEAGFVTSAELSGNDIVITFVITTAHADAEPITAVVVVDGKIGGKVPVTSQGTNCSARFGLKTFGHADSTNASTPQFLAERKVHIAVEFSDHTASFLTTATAEKWLFSRTHRAA